MYKKLYLVLLFTISSSCLIAQHISFLGIRLGQSEMIVDKALQEKGFKYQGMNVFGQKRMYEGPFWNFDKTIINLSSENGVATDVCVFPVGSFFQYDYDALVRALDNKYGEHQSAHNLFQGILLWFVDLEYYWKTDGGYIVTSIVHKEAPNENEMSISIYYLDNTSTNVLQVRGLNSRGNDL